MMPVTRRIGVLAAALLVVAAGCGDSRQKKLFNQIQGECNAAASSGWTLRQALEAFNGANLYSAVPVCDPTLGNLPPPATDTCGPSSATDPTCSVFFEWAATDSSLCNPGGGCCLLCELRVKKSQLDAHATNTVDTPICASRGAQGQVCQLF